MSKPELNPQAAYEWCNENEDRYHKTSLEFLKGYTKALTGVEERKENILKFKDIVMFCDSVGIVTDVITDTHVKVNVIIATPDHTHQETWISDNCTLIYRKEGV